MIGRTIDRYRIESKLGEGGMGVVYKATDLHLDRSVAIKVLPHDKVADPSRRQRFVQEARAASALNHPGIVTVHDIRADAGVDFIVMEYVTGRTLDQVIPAKGMRLTQALRYGAEIADALSRAHEAGILHRDLKPSNLMVTDDDHIKVLDFGLAKLLDPMEGAADMAPTAAAPLTEMGAVVGTAAYMSPEQAEGHRLDARSDIFSLGSVLYEMVTGRRPFSGDSTVSLLAKILRDDPLPPGQLVSGVSNDVERTILRCLRKDPARRYQTMADLKVALEDLVTDSGDQATAQRAHAVAANRWRLAALVAGVAVILAIAGYAAMHRTRTLPSPVPLRAVPLTTLPGVSRSPSFSPDGNQVAFSWTGAQQNNSDVYVQHIGAGSPLRITSDPGNDYGPLWSPDGRWIAFLRRTTEGVPQELRLVPPLGGPERKLTDIRSQSGFLRPITLAWCPDSQCLVVTDSRGTGVLDALFLVSLESGEKRQLTHPSDRVLADTDPAISPDGKWLVFRRDSGPFNGELMRYALDGSMNPIGEPVRLTTTADAAYGPRWMPDGTEILFSARGSLWRLGMRAGSVAERLPFVGEDGLSPAISRAESGRPSRLVYVRSFADMNIWRVDVPDVGVPATTPPVVAVASTRRDAIATLSADGRHIAFTSDRSGNLEVWRSDPSGANAVQLTSMGAIPGFQRWSPDGSLLAFHSNPEGQGDIFVVSADGGRPRNLTSHPANDTFPAFSSDGQWVYFTSTRTGELAIWKMPSAGGPAVRFSPGTGFLAVPSPDGAFVYYVDSGSLDKTGPLLRVPVSGGAPVKILDSVTESFVVLKDGIYYLERPAGNARLLYYDFATGLSGLVASNLGNIFWGLTATPDGRSIYYSRVDSSVDDLMLVENFR